MPAEAGSPDTHFYLQFSLLSKKNPIIRMDRRPN